MSAKLVAQALSAELFSPYGEVIEVAPALLVPVAEGDALAASFLGHYMFQTDNRRRYVIGLGLTSLINHGENANAEFHISVDSIKITATRAIGIGAEITIDYGWRREEWASVGVDYKPAD